MFMVLKKVKILAFFLCGGILVFTLLGCSDLHSLYDQTNENDYTNTKVELSNTEQEDINKNINWTDIKLAPSDSAFFYKDGHSYSIQNRQLRSASMIKVYILSYLFKQVDEGNVSLSDIYVLKESDKVGGSGILSGYDTGTILTIDELARLMITESDNTATNILIDWLGMDNINAYIQDQAYHDTKLNRKMMDFDAIDKGLDNFTSSQDLGRWFVSLAEGKLASPSSNAKMLDYLLGQTDVECLPTALSNRKIAHKTGELSGAYHDGGIIYDANENEFYVLVLLSDGYDSRASTIDQFKIIAKQVDSKFHEKK